MPLPTEYVPPTFHPVPMPVSTADGLIRYDVRYSLVPGFRPLELDLYVSNEPVTEPRPLVVWVHGGGYSGGHRRDSAPWIASTERIQKLVRRGFAVASVDYRLGYEASFPAAVQDLRAALNWLIFHSSQLQLTTSNIGLWGESAGAHLAWLTALTLDNSEFEPKYSAQASSPIEIMAIVDWYGAKNLANIVRPMDGSDESQSEARRYPPEFYNLGPERWKDQNWLKIASPNSYLNSTMPPALVIHGLDDSMVPYEQSENFVADALRAGAVIDLVPVPKSEHVWMGVSQEMVEHIVDISIEHFVKHLWPR